MDDSNFDNRRKIIIAIGTRHTCHEMLEVLDYDDIDTMKKLYHEHLISHIKNEKLNNKIKNHIESFVQLWKDGHRTLRSVYTLDHSIKKTYQNDMDIVISINEVLINEDEIDYNNESIKNRWNSKYALSNSVLLEYNGKCYTKKEIIDMIEKESNMKRFDWKQYVCDIKALAESITNGMVNGDILEKLQLENMVDNYRKECNENITGDVDLEMKIEDAKNACEPLKELTHVASRCGDDTIKMKVIEILKTYCLCASQYAHYAATYEEVMAFVQMTASWNKIIDKLVYELNLKTTSRQ